MWKGLSDSFTHRVSIIWNALAVKSKSSPSLASFKGNIAKHSKSIDGISFVTSSTVTYKNTDDFINFTFRLPFLQIILLIYACRTLLYSFS